MIKLSKFKLKLFRNIKQYNKTIIAIALVVVSGIVIENICFSSSNDFNPLLSKEYNIKHIILDNAQNVRELGGYFTQNKKITKWHLFLRSDNTALLSDEDVNVLKGYGVVTVIDLRNSKEVGRSEDKFTSIDGVKYFNISLESSNKKSEPNVEDKSINKVSKGYIDLLENGKSSLKKIFDVIANNLDGTILFHCVTGKDRTGLLSMLLLGLAEAYDVDIISNYEISHTCVKNTEYFRKASEKYGEENMLSPPKYIENTINYIKANYDTFEKYLLSCDISKENLLKTKNKFLE